MTHALPLLGRAFLALLAFLGAALGAAALASSTAFLPDFEMNLRGGPVVVGLQNLSTTTRLLVVGGSALLLLLSAGVASLAVRAHQERRFILVGENKAGPSSVDRVTVSSRSVHGLVSYCTSRIPGVMEARARVRLEREGWDVKIDLRLARTARIPEVVSAVRREVLPSLEAHTGIDIKRTRIHTGLERSAGRARVG